MILRYFEESECNAEANGDCCDVCCISEGDIQCHDCQEELAAVIKVVKDYPDKGVKKVCLYLR